MISSLKPNEIFVFCSNRAGIHGAGAARTAARLFGASHGVGEGRTGRCYAVPTKDERLLTLPLSDIKESIDRLGEPAREHPELDFLVTAIGCGYAGYDYDRDILPLLGNLPENCKLIPPER